MDKNVDKNGVETVGDSGVLQMESIWKTGFPKMKLRVYQFDRCVWPAMISGVDGAMSTPSVDVFYALHVYSIVSPYLTNTSIV